MAKNDFSKGSVVKNILALAVPMTLAQLITMLYNIVDRIYIGRFGQDASTALTGLGICFPIISIIMAFANLVGMGGAPLFSIKRGEGKDEEAKMILGNSFVLLVIFSVILTAAGLIFKRSVLYLLGASDITFPYADKYISIYLLGTIFVVTSLGMNAFINAQGFGKIGMTTVAIGAGLNIILDPVFIFALGLGVRGAAVATVISQFISAVWTIGFLLSRHTLFKITLSGMKLQLARVKSLVTLGMAGFMMQVTNGAVQMVCNATLAKWGNDTYIGIMTIINSIREIVWLPVHGLTSSTQPIIGFNYGAGEFERVKAAIRFMVACVLALGISAWLAVLLFPTWFLGIFTSDPAILKYGVSCMHIYFFGFFLMALQASGQSVFTGLGKSGYAVFFSILRKGIIVIPLTIFLPFMFGVNGVFLAEPISNFLGGGAAFVTMYLTIYRHLGK